MKKITKIAMGVGGVLTGLYVGVLAMLVTPVLPAQALDISATMCPTINGVNVPGCVPGVNAPSVSSIISFGLNVLIFVAFVAALGFLIFGGIRWIISGGDKEGTAKAKSTVTAALIGLVIVLAAWVLLNIVLQLVTGSGVSSLTIPQLK